MKMTVLRKLPIGIQDFESLITDKYLYVDKTEQIHRLITTGRYYFLSRPRRFGKSLLMSTIHALFSGKKELFEGLAIASKPDVTWEEHPVLHLDLNTQKYDCPEALDNILEEFITRQEAIYGSNPAEQGLGLRFQGVIRRACEKTGKRVVILVDEYDKPMLQAIGNPQLQDEYRAVLKGFYGALKSMDGCIKFALLTGVTKFGKVSVFSDLNNLEDISMDEHYADICGITEKELLTNFDAHIESLAEKNDMPKEKAITRLREQYDGYHFHWNCEGVYNPFSLLNCLKQREFKDYWFETGTPTYLVELLKKHDYNLERMSCEETSADVLNSIDSNSTNPIPVIYQSGYLTIKDYDSEFGTYTLGFPNKEVENGFMNFLVPYYTPISSSGSAFEIKSFVKDVRQGNTEAFIKRLRSFFADTPYELIKNVENHYQNVVFILFKLMGFHTQAEYHTSEGRIDLVVKTPKFCYVLEFKLDGTAEEALEQISEKNYTLPFAIEDQQVIRIGINFDSKTRNIDKAIVG